MPLSSSITRRHSPHIAVPAVSDFAVIPTKLSFKDFAIQTVSLAFVCDQDAFVCDQDGETVVNR
jgi:hypothetical protein